MCLYELQKDQCEQCKKKLKQLNQQLSQERLERGTLELQAQGLQDLKLRCADQEKAMAALKLSVQVSVGVYQYYY